MKKEPLHTSQSGFLLVEVILAVSVFVLLVTALVGAWLYGQESTMLAGERVRAALLAEEGLEAARNIGDEDFANLADGTHGLAISGGGWAFSGSSDTSGVFTRQLEISSVDDDRKEITATVTWQQNQQREGNVSLVTYLTNWQEEVGGPPGGGGPPDCTGPPGERPPECDDEDEEEDEGGGGPPDCTGPPWTRPPECSE
ncbi:MAG: hypothetical protein WDZ93_00475 [Candidatus Paceibacterota bacterium]